MLACWFVCPSPTVDLFAQTPTGCVVLATCRQCSSSGDVCNLQECPVGQGVENDMTCWLIELNCYLVRLGWFELVPAAHWNTQVESMQYHSWASCWTCLVHISFGTRTRGLFEPYNPCTTPSRLTVLLLRATGLEGLALPLIGVGDTFWPGRKDPRMKKCLISHMKTYWWPSGSILMINRTRIVLACYVECRRVDLFAQTPTGATCWRHVPVMSATCKNVVLAGVSKTTGHVGFSQHVSQIQTHNSAQT
jgi:hypothetical protein